MTLYNIFNGFEVDANVYPANMVTTTPPPAPGYTFVGGLWITSSNSVSERLDAVKDEVYTRINDRVIELYNIYSPLFMEYTQRETQALTWQKANYTGSPPPQVLAFSDPARMNPVEACKLIIFQANQFRAALDFLAGLRMKKIEVESAVSIAQARDIESKTLASIEQVLASLP